MDIVQTLTRKVPVRLADEYFGISASHDEQMMDWARACFREFFINLLEDPVVRHQPSRRAPRCASVSTRFWRSAAPRTLRAGTMSWAACCACSVRVMSQASTMTAYAEP